MTVAVGAVKTMGVTWAGTLPMTPSLAAIFRVSATL